MIFTGDVHRLNDTSVDTDRMFPARFLKTTRQDNLGDLFFYDERHDDAGQPLPAGPFARPPRRPAILLAGAEFGCGSSREHAVWALRDFGFHVVVTSGAGDIFRRNCSRNRVLLAGVSGEDLQALLLAEPAELTLDTTGGTITACSGLQVPFSADGFGLYCFRQGTDIIDYLLDPELPVAATMARQFYHNRTGGSW